LKTLKAREVVRARLANAHFIENKNKKRDELINEADEICSAILELCDVWHPIYLEMVDNFKNEAV
jgi:hypothetical protein